MTIPNTITDLDVQVYAPPSQGEWTVADWERLPDDGYLYEVIDGVLTMSPSPSNFHQWIVFVLTRYLGIPLTEQRAGVCFFAPVGLVVPPALALQPDFLLVLNQNQHIIRGGRIRGAPDLVVEVLSPGNTTQEMENKRRAYEHIGVPEYAVIDPASRTLSYYRRQETGTYGEGQVYGEGDTITFACLPSVTLAIADLFADAPDTTIRVE